VSVAREPAAVFGAGALPELDRAVAVVGLFATGTTDCARKVFDLPAFATRSTSPDRILVGCLGMPVPLRLAELVDQIDGGDAHRLDGILGDDAPAIRMYAKDWRSVPFSEQIRRAIDKLTTTAEFWIAYQSQVLTAYARAVVLARQCGLVSERGRLLIFDRLNQSGLNPIARAMRAYSERYPANSPDRPTTERARILALGDIFKEYESSLMSLPSPVKDRISRRIDTIVSGKGTIRGISFDLNELGISDSG
jgi:hypothetical protein